MSNSAKCRVFHGHTGKHHTEETKLVLREKALLQLKNGGFPQTKTIPHVLFAGILTELGLVFEEEVKRGCFCFDFHVVRQNVYVEVDGDYWHSNPKFYPNGPITKSQKINWFRDLKKNDFAKREGLFVLRFWEYDIINNKQMAVDALEKI
jgi:very-short-patch-repair endonuclease